LNFEVIRHTGGTLRLLDQRRLPGAVEYPETADYRKVIAAINSLAVRGAPLIGAAGAYAVVLAARELFADGISDPAGRLQSAAEEIANARPTAVNLGWAVRRTLAAGMKTTGVFAAIIAALENEAAAIVSEDRAACDAIGANGAARLLAISPGPLTILTHCNAGALATCGIGTALGVVRHLHRQGRLQMVFAGVTRPLNQGARLTAWELAQDSIPVTVLADSMAASLLASGKVDAIVTGADRIAVNGDAANKIGTFSLAIIAQRFKVPLFIAAPRSSFDPACPDGAAIPIEQRDPGEIAAAPGANIYNPAFDVTPAALISGYITQDGVFSAAELPDFLHKKRNSASP
jgi:methylthioribose-1-phosphate isomerase